jgi:hypothetical protein
MRNKETHISACPILSSTELNLQQLQSQMNEYKNVIANQKADITQKQSNLTT